MCYDLMVVSLMVPGTDPLTLSLFVKATQKSQIDGQCVMSSQGRSTYFPSFFDHAAAAFSSAFVPQEKNRVGCTICTANISGPFVMQCNLIPK